MFRPWIVIALVVYGVVASISMIVLGWPEETPAQVVVLELAALPLQAAVGVGLWYLSRRMRPLGSRGRLARWIAVGLAAAGLVLIGVAYLGPRGLVHPGLALVWIGLLMALVLVVAHLPRRPMRELFRVLPDDEDEDLPADEVAVDDLLHEPEDELHEPEDEPEAEPTDERSSSVSGDRSLRPSDTPA